VSWDPVAGSAVITAGHTKWWFISEDMTSVGGSSQWAEGSMIPELQNVQNDLQYGFSTHSYWCSFI